MRTYPLATALLVACLLAAACGGGDPGPLQVTSVTLARDDGAGEPGETVEFFRPGDRTFHAQVELNRMETGLEGRIVWIAVDAGGEQNVVIAEADLSSLVANKISGRVELPRDWPVGRYRLDLYVEGALLHSHDFEVRAS